MVLCLLLSFQVSPCSTCLQRRMRVVTEVRAEQFSVRVELADTQLLPHPNDCICEVALGAEMHAGFVSEKVLLRHTCRGLGFFPWFTSKDC